MIIWLIFIGLEIYRNYFLIKKKKVKPIYIHSFIIRAISGILIAISTDPFGLWLNIIQSVPIIVFEITSFYILFDPILNKLLSNKWNYRGLESGWFDSLPLPIYYIMKILCIIGLIVSIIILI